VVQEALTNVIRHAAATGASARIDCGPDRILVDVHDDGRGGEIDPDRVGQGITGMMERVEAHGGELRAGPAPGGGFAVHAVIPHDRGADLFISPATVRTHVGRLLSKLEVRDRAGLVAAAYRSGLDIPEP